MTTLVVSPHLDDAMLSVGGGIAASKPTLLATVLAGLPPTWSWPSPFDNACGFDDSECAVVARRREDAEACALLGAIPRHMAYLDGQYGLDQDGDAAVDRLARLMAGADVVAVPLGIMHPDHRMVAKWCRRALALLTRCEVLVYADLPGAVLWPSHVPGALRGWQRAGFDLEAVEWPCDLAAKARARECYASQLRFGELAFENLTKEHGWIATRSG